MSTQEHFEAVDGVCYEEIPLCQQQLEAEKELEELATYAAHLEQQVQRLRGDADPAMRHDRLLIYERNKRLIAHQRQVFKMNPPAQPAVDEISVDTAAAMDSADPIAPLSSASVAPSWSSSSIKDVASTPSRIPADVDSDRRAWEAVFLDCDAKRLASSSPPRRMSLPVRQGTSLPATTRVAPPSSLATNEKAAWKSEVPTTIEAASVSLDTPAWVIRSDPKLADLRAMCDKQG